MEKNCALNCNEHCIGCNRINGICDNGCIPGWKGKFCDEECKRGFYGKDCNLQCGHCHESAQCHLENGSCLDGCSAGYKGLLCNKENLALWRPAWQSSSHDPTVSGPEKVVDGRKTDLSYNGRQCSVSADKRTTATWWVNLTDIVSINNIVIYYRTDNIPWGASNGYTGRFMGFYVYISNTTKREDGHLCFHDRNYTRATIPAVANITCPFHGQYVIYYNERPVKDSYTTGHSTYAFIELCCSSPRRYGSNCSEVCPTNCKEYCHIESGNCLQCFPGYRGDRCDQACLIGTFGENCQEKCNSTCYMYHCDIANGKCTTGCYPGWKGDYCHEVCKNGTFGRNCLKTCNSTCYGCNRTNGKCDTGCHPGWKGEYCHKECLNNFYGEGCNVSCGQCLNGKQCHHINGSCQGACEPGYNGDKCDEVCPDGTYGSECKSICSEGCLSVCDKKNGTCEKCREGYTGAFCIDAHALQRRMTSIVEVAGITTSIACFSILFALVLKRERLAAM